MTRTEAQDRAVRIWGEGAIAVTRLHVGREARDISWMVMIDGEDEMHGMDVNGHTTCHAPCKELEAQIDVKADFKAAINDSDIVLPAAKHWICSRCGESNRLTSYPCWRCGARTDMPKAPQPPELICLDYRPDHNGECLNCDEPWDEHRHQVLARMETTLVKIGILLEIPIPESEGTALTALDEMRDLLAELRRLYSLPPSAEG